MVVHHDDIILEVRLLRQGTLDGIADGLGTVEDWNNDGSLHIELLLIEVNVLILSCIDQCTNLSEMGRTGLFHLHLDLAIGRIHVVELLFTRNTEVGFLFGVEILVEVEQSSLTAQEETQVIETGILIVALAIGGGILVQHRGAQQQ